MTNNVVILPRGEQLRARRRPTLAERLSEIVDELRGGHGDAIALLLLLQQAERVKRESLEDLLTRRNIGDVS